jgi:hypothetical protein
MIEKFIKKGMYDILELSEEEIESVFAGQLDSEQYNLLMNNKKVFPFLVDTELLQLLEDWLNVRNTIPEETLEELKDLIDLNYKY